MSQQKHTPGPYGYGEDNDGWYLESLSAKAKLGHGGEIAYCLSKNDARRISACLNACNDLPNEALGGGWTAKGIGGYARSLERQIEALKADQAKLLEALGYCEGWFAMHSPTAKLINGHFAEHPMLTCIRAAIAKANEGGK